MWADKAMRDSSHINESNSGMVKPMFTFGRAPGTAGQPFGSLGNSSQEGGNGMFAQMAGRTANQFM